VFKNVLDESKKYVLTVQLHQLSLDGLLIYEYAMGLNLMAVARTEKVVDACAPALGTATTSPLQVELASQSTVTK
jgi:hypothetical protein